MADNEREVAPSAPVESGGEAPARGEKSRWRRFLLLYAAVFLLLGALGCFVLYRYAAAYERSLPEHVMDRLMAETSEEEWYAYIRPDAPLAVSELEDGEKLFDAYFDAAIRGRGFSYRKAPGLYSETQPVYTVRGGGQDLCTVTLVPEGKGAAGFGRELWQLGEIRSCFTLDALESVALVIDAPAGEPVFVNGTALPEQFRTDEPVTLPDRSALEQRLDVGRRFVRWRVDAMYGDIVVTDQNGTVLSPEREDGGVLHYRLLPAQALSLAVRAPADATVLTDGIALPAQEATEETAAIFAGLETLLPGPLPRERVWRYEGLCYLPEVTARDPEGRALTPLAGPGGELRFYPPEDEALKAEVEPQVRQFFEWYTLYAANAYNANLYYTLLGSILEGTELYDYVLYSADAMVWASQTEIAYEELSFEHFHRVSEDCFTCTVRFRANVTATSWYESQSYELQGAYELAFVHRGWNWLAAAMSVLSY